jgi:hypothetical protein
MNKNKLGALLAIGVMVFGILIVIVPNVVSQSSSFVEDFEEQTLLFPPTSTQYTYTTTGSINSLVVNNIVHGGNQSMKLAPSTITTAGGHFGFTPPNDSDLFCGSIQTLWVYLTALPPSTTTTSIQLTDGAQVSTTVSSRLEIRIASTGAITIYFENSGGTETPKITGTTMPINTWVDFVFSGDDTALTCSGVNFFVASNVLGFSQSSVATMNDLNTLDIVFIGDQSSVSPVLYLDDFGVSGISVAPTLGSFDTTVATTTLTDMAVLDNGGYVIARTNAGSTIRVFTGETLTERYTDSTGCTGGQGIAALSDDGFAYFECPSIASSPTTLTLISPDGTKYPLNCDNSPDITTCLAHDTSFDIAPVDNNENFVSLYPIVSGEITTDSNNDQLTTDQHGQVHEFAFFTGESTSTISVLDVATWEVAGTGSASDDSGDSVASDQAAYASNAPQELCRSNILNGYVVQPASQTKGYIANIDATPFQDLGDHADVDVNPSITANGFVGSTTVNNGEDISCSNTGKILVNSPSGAGRVSMVDPSTGTTLWSVVGVYSDVALSGDTKWAALSIANDKTYFYNATSGEFLCQLTNPSGSIVDLILDKFGQRLYLATSTAISYKATYTCTTGNPVGPGGVTTSSSTSTTSGTSTAPVCLGCTSLPSTGPGSKPFGIDINYVAQGLNVSVLGVQILIGFILMVIFFIWMYRGSGGSVIAGMFGSVLGLAVATVMGFIPPWAVMLVVLAILVVLGKMLFGAFTGAGGE